MGETYHKILSTAMWRKNSLKEEEYDSDYDSNLSSPRLSENEEMESDVVMPINLENAKWQTNKSSGQAAFVSLL